MKDRKEQEEEANLLWNEPMEWPSPKRKKSKQVVTSNIVFPESILNARDTEYNIYPETPQEPLSIPNKVTFYSEWDGKPAHKYILQDANGTYPDLLISGSGLLAYWQAYNKQPRSNLARLASSSNEERSTGIYSTTVPLAGSMFVSHLNTFAERKDGITHDRPYMTYIDRRQRMFDLQGGTPKDFSQFVPSCVFKEIETWLVQGSPTFSPFVHSPERDVKTLCSFVKPFVESVKHDALREALLGAIEQYNVSAATSVDVSRGYQIGAKAGTDLHEYLEFRLTDLDAHTPELARAKFPLRENEDYMHVEDFISHLGTSRFEHLELRLGSFRHKICGSMDGFMRLPNGLGQVWDWKRTPAFAEDDWFRVPVTVDNPECDIVKYASQTGRIRIPMFGSIALSHNIVKYALQASAYRKLSILEGMGPMSTRAYLFVSHPAMPSWYLVLMNLDEKLKYDSGNYFRDLGAKFGDAGRSLTPIETAELLFEHRELHLLAQFGL